MRNNAGKIVSFARYWIDYKIYLAFWDKFPRLPVWSEGPPLYHKILSSMMNTFTIIKLHSFHTHPHAILKNRVYFEVQGAGVIVIEVFFHLSS